MNHDPTLDSGYPTGRPVRVELTLTDGTVLECAETVARGDTDRRTSGEEWRRQIGQLVGDDAATALFRFVDEPPASWSARDVGEAGAGRGQASKSSVTAGVRGSD